MGQTSHSDAGPSRRTSAVASTPSAIPKTNSTSRNGTSASPYERKERPNTADESASITASPIALVATLASTSPATYSGMDSGEANRLRKLRDQTSSKKAIDTPCMARVKKSQSSTAPSRSGTKSTPAPLTVLSHRVMKPQS